MDKKVYAMMQFVQIIGKAGVIAAAAAASASAIAAEAQPLTLQAVIGNPANFTLSGSFRARYEALDAQFRPGLDSSDKITVLRTTLAAEYHNKVLKIGAELIDARAYFDDRNSSAGTGEVNTFELAQGYVGLNFGDVFGAKSKTEVTAGRFTLDLGSRRFVARNDYRNYPNAFTGTHADWQGADGEKLTLLYTLPQLRLPADRASILDNQTEFDQEKSALRFWGGFLSLPKAIPTATVELYLFGLEENDANGRPTRNRHLYTPGTRVYRAPKAGGLDYEVEGAYQFGNARTGTSASAPKRDVSAYFARGQIGETLKLPWSPRLALGFDLASGDKAGSKSINRFDTLYGARRFDFGPTGIYGPFSRANIVSPEARLEVKPNARWDALLAYRAAWLESTTDSFSNTGVRDNTGRSGRFAGHQIETRVRYWLVPKRVRLESGGAVLLDGRFLDDAPNNPNTGNTLYGYFSVTTTF
jgi:hypothetical protein